MNKQMQECMKPHVMVHSFFGLGLGVFAASLLSIQGTFGILLGLVFMVAAIVIDATMAKKKK